MKQILFLLSFVMFVFLAKSQTTLTASSSTNTDAVTQTHILDASSDASNFALLTIQVVGTKSGGTPAGTCVLYGSLDGTTYWAIGSDTATIANSATTVSHKWELSNTRYRYYKVAVATTGTQVSTYIAKAVGRKTPK